MHPFHEKLAAQNSTRASLAVVVAEGGLVELLELSRALLARPGSGGGCIAPRVILVQPRLVQDGEDRPAAVTTELLLAARFEPRRGDGQGTVRALWLGLRRHSSGRRRADIEGGAHRALVFWWQGQEPGVGSAGARERWPWLSAAAAKAGRLARAVTVNSPTAKITAALRMGTWRRTRPTSVLSTTPRPSSTGRLPLQNAAISRAP